MKLQDVKIEGRKRKNDDDVRRRGCLQFGEIDIDSDLVSIREDLDPDGEQIMMLNNGCICCTVRSDLVDMLSTLVSDS